MLSSPALLLVACSCVAAGNPDPAPWRSARVEWVQSESLRLDLLIDRLNGISPVPIHFIRYGRIHQIPTIREFQTGPETTLGQVFDEIALQVPGLKAFATPKGVLWQSPVSARCLNPIAAKLDRDRFDGTLDEFMQLTLNPIYSSLRTGGAGSEIEADRQINLRFEKNCSIRDAMIAIAEANTGNLVLGFDEELNEPLPADALPTASLPAVFYRIDKRAR